MRVPLLVIVEEGLWLGLEVAEVLMVKVTQLEPRGVEVEHMDEAKLVVPQGEELKVSPPMTPKELVVEIVGVNFMERDTLADCEEVKVEAVVRVLTWVTEAVKVFDTVGVLDKDKTPDWETEMEEDNVEGMVTVNASVALKEREGDPVFVPILGEEPDEWVTVGEPL